jgi:Na+-translocating ferredoxin:NAD+ oxidoreductase RnfD subunit
VSPPLRSPLPRLLADPRHFQIAFLGSFLAYGLTALAFPLRPLDVLAAMGGALLAEAATSRLRGKRFDPRSPLITSLSLSLILRAASPWVYLLAGAAAIAGKALLRVRGKHLFNPAALGIAVAVLLTDRAWISPGQWGSGPTLLFLFLAAGGMVVHRALRSDVSWAFLAAYAALTLARAGWLGDPWEVPFHSLQSGALLLFAFFMISDPKTTPDARPARLLYAVLVALGAGFVHFVLHRPNGFLWSLLALAPVVPALDLLLPAARYRWAAMRARSVLRLTEKEIVMPASSRLPARASSRAALVVLLPLALGLGFAARRRLLRLLRLEGRHQAVQRVVEGGAGARRRPHRDHHGRRLPGRSARVRAGGAGADLPHPRPDPRRRAGGDRPPRRLHRAAAGRVPRLEPLRRVPDAKMAQRARRRRRLAWPIRARAERDLGVTVEAKYTVGEYDILILSAEESQRLETWLHRNGYRIPRRRLRRARQLPAPGDALLRGQGEPRRAARLGVQNLRPAPDGVTRLPSSCCRSGSAR